MTYQKFNRRFASSAFLVSTGSIISFALSTLLQMLIAALFGAGYNMDAYFTSAVIPTFLAVVMTTGLTFVLVPAVIQEERERGVQSSSSLAGTAIFYTFLIMVSVTILIVLSSQMLIALIAPGLGLSQRAVAANLLQIQILALPFMGVGNLTMGVRNAKNSFLLPALTPGVGSLANILVILFLNKNLGVYSLAWGFVVAHIVIALFNLIPIANRAMTQFLPIRDYRIIELARLSLPFIMFGVIQRSLPLFERYFASTLPGGQISYLGYASRVANIMIITFGAGIATSLLPALSRTYSEFGRKGLRELSEQGLIATASFSVPATVFFFVTGQAFTDLFLGRGRFDLQASQSVGSIMGWCAIVVTSTMFGNVLGRSFYAMKITWISPMVGVIGVLIYVVIAHYWGLQWEYRGLIISQVISLIISVLLQTVFLMRKLQDRFRAFWILLLWLVILGFFLGWLMSWVFIWFEIQSSLVILFLTGIGILIGYGLFFYMYDQELLLLVLELTGVNRIFRLAGIGINF